MKTKKNYVAAGLGLAQLVLLSGNALAQQEPVRNLNEVVVTATRSSKKQSEIGKVVRVISAETLSRSQGRSLPEVLNQVAGLTIGGNGNTPGDIKSVYLRGAAPGNTLILVDGIPMNDASGITGEYDISAIPVHQVERIEIVKGGNSTLYGSDAVAGVISIITKKGAGKLTASVLATGGSYETYKQVLGLNGNISQTSISFTASNLSSENFSTAAPGAGETNFDKDEFTQRSVNLNLGQQVSERLSLRAHIQANGNAAGLDNGAFADAYDYTYQKNSVIAGLGGKLNLGKGEFNFNMTHNAVKNLFDNQGSITDNRGQISQAEAGINYALTSFLELTSGLSYKRSATEQENPFSAPLFADNNIKSIFTSFFLKTGSGFNAELGGRVNDHSEFGENFTYTINPSYVIRDRYKLFVNISSAYHVPSLYQLFSEYGNLDLKPETSRTYEAGFDFDLLPQKLNVNLSYFDRKISDVIDFGQLSATRFGYINQNEQNDKGFETEISYKPADKLTIDAFYAYVNGEMTSPAGTAFNLYRRPKNTFGATAGLTISKSVLMSMSYKFTSSREDYYFDASFNQVSADLESYNMLDAYIQYQPVSKLTLFADVKNLLDENYREFEGYNTKGLNFNTGFRWEIR
ncbi:TonB-dependent receptor [Flavihumibacter sp. R14]|nr:TonB-dependent receptor [Flavihumibacter soli]